ncbi:MerR-like DNA binding protein [Nocardia alba]|uniref:MerR-like DNA binding protein n=2 Tax=Nocardia alba TaxID=225051 RepID=A0A4R1FTK3_9NOCA|nr:MerR-like DNA binding protein [Nocardia alba]
MTRRSERAGQNETMPAGSAPASAAAGFTVRAVADRLGIPTATLRSWNRRYGIGPAQDRPGRHRLYTDTDIAVLENMVALIGSGASPAGAAAAARGPVPVLGDRVGLLDAAFALDTTAVCAHLEAHVRVHGVVRTWDTLCRPAFTDIVARQGGGEGCIDVEHALSWSIAAVMQQVKPARSSAPVLLACTSGETHSLPLDVLRAALAQDGVGARMLGADVPTVALSDALARHARGAAVLLWSQRESTALTSAVLACAGAGARVLIGGPGWDAVLLPDTVERVAGLADAVAALR